MIELDTYKAFFRAWEQLNALPKKAGRPDMEKQAALDHLAACAEAVKTYKPGPVVQDAALFRALQSQIASIPPKDTR